MDAIALHDFHSVLDTLSCGAAYGSAILAEDGSVLDFSIDHMNSAGQSSVPLMGSTASALWSEVFPGIRTQYVWTRFSKVCLEREPFEILFNDTAPFIRSASGAFADIRAVPFGRFGYFATWRDVADAPDDPSRLEHQRQLLEDVLAVSNHAIARCDLSGRLTWCNQGYLNLAGVATLEEAKGRLVTELVRYVESAPDSDLADPEDYQGYIDHLRTHGTHRMIGRFENAFGLTWQMEWVSRRIVNDRGDFTYIQGVGADLSRAQQAASAFHDVTRLLARTREMERLALAQRLHADALQHLVAATWEIAALPESSRAAELVRAAIDGIEQCLGEIVAPTSGNASLSAFVDEAVVSARASGLDLSVSLSQPHTEATARLAARIIDEALDNIVRHAAATSATVVARHLRSGSFEIEVTDDGSGYDLISATQAAATGRLSLISLRAMVESCNGVLSVGPHQPRGTRLIAAIPGNLASF